MPTTVRVDLYEGEIQAVLSDDVGRFVVSTTLKVFNRAKVLCPVDTGTLRASHQMRVYRTTAAISGEVGTLVRYALPVHEGVRARIIVPRTKQALAFTWHGVPMVRRSVSQGPRKGRPWLKDALTEVAAQEGYRMTNKNLP